MKAMTICKVGLDADLAEKTLKEHGAEIFMRQVKDKRVKFVIFYPEEEQDYFDNVFNSQIV